MKLTDSQQAVLDAYNDGKSNGLILGRKALADATGVTQGTVGGAMRALKLKGLIQEQREPGDHRATVTPKRAARRQEFDVDEIPSADRPLDEILDARKKAYSRIARRDDALKMVRSAMLLASIFPEFKYQADNLARELDELVDVEAGIRAEQSAQAAEAKQLNEERGNITWLLAEKKARLEQHQVELKSVRQAAETHAKSITRLDDLLKAMDKELANAQRAAAKKVVEIKPETKKVAFLSPGRIKPAVPFARSKGTMLLPVRGRQVRDFAADDKLGGNAKGVSIETRAQAQVTSPADGWVVYAGEFRSYGQLLILNGGGGYHILLAGMKQIDVSPGQFVLAGEPVAAMGAAAPAGGEAKETRPVLYVEFRKDGQPIDPGPWWAERSEKVQG